MHGIPCNRSTVPLVTELLPNLETLLDELTGDRPAVRDARALAEAARVASTEQELDAALDEVVAAWRRS